LAGIIGRCRDVRALRQHQATATRQESSNWSRACAPRRIAAAGFGRSSGTLGSIDDCFVKRPVRGHGALHPLRFSTERLLGQFGDASLDARRTASGGSCAGLSPSNDLQRATSPGSRCSHGGLMLLLRREAPFARSASARALPCRPWSTKPRIFPPAAFLGGAEGRFVILSPSNVFARSP